MCAIRWIKGNKYHFINEPVLHGYMGHKRFRKSRQISAIVGVSSLVRTLPLIVWCLLRELISKVYKVHQRLLPKHSLLWVMILLAYAQRFAIKAPEKKQTNKKHTSASKVGVSGTTVYGLAAPSFQPLVLWNCFGGAQQRMGASGFHTLLT